MTPEHDQERRAAGIRRADVTLTIQSKIYGLQRRDKGHRFCCFVAEAAQMAGEAVIKERAAHQEITKALTDKAERAEAALAGVAHENERLRVELAKAQRERDEARALLRELRPHIECGCPPSDGMPGPECKLYDLLTRVGAALIGEGRAEGGCGG